MTSSVHVEWLRETAGVGDNVDKLRATMGNLVQSGATMGTDRILSRVTFDKKVSCVARRSDDE